MALCKQVTLLAGTMRERESLVSLLYLLFLWGERSQFLVIDTLKKGKRSKKTKGHGLPLSLVRLIEVRFQVLIDRQRDVGFVCCILEDQISEKELGTRLFIANEQTKA